MLPVQDFFSLSRYDFHARRAEWSDRFLAEGRKKIGAAHNQFPLAVALYNEQHELVKTPHGEAEFLKRYAELPPEQKTAFMRFSEFDWLADYASWQRAKIERPDTRENNPYHLVTLIRSLKEAGAPRDYVEQAMNNFLNGCSGTNHPTGYLDEAQELETEADGVDRLLALITANGAEEIDGAISDLLNPEIRITPETRANTLGEIAFKSRYALRAINARNKELNEIVNAVDEVYGPPLHYLEPTNFSRPDTHLDLAVRMWEDYDGKANAEYWTLLSAEAITTYMSLSHHLWRMEQASAAIACPDYPAKEASVPELARLIPDVQKIHDEMQPLYGLLAGIRGDLKIILDEVTQHHKELNDKTITPTERADRFAGKEQTFNEILGRMGRLYNGRILHGRTLGNKQGLFVYKEIVDEFARLRERAHGAGWSDTARNHIINSRRDLHADGLTIFRMEPRHNHLVNTKIIDNLFRHEAFLSYLESHKILTRAEVGSIRRENGKAVERARKKNQKEIEGGFSTLPINTKFELLNEIEKEMACTGNLREFLLTANPLAFDDNGYPAQTYGSIRRKDVMAQYQLKYGPLFIVAESDEFGERLEKFLCCDHYKLDSLVPTALTEDLASMRKAHEHRVQNFFNGGADYIEWMRSRKVPAQYIRAMGAIMLARSDIQRNFGPLAGMLVYAMAALITDEAARRGSPDIIKEGGGLDNTRGGGDLMVMMRVIAQRLQEWQRQNNKKLPPEIRAMAVSLMATIQGRALYKSAPEIAYELKDQLSEMIGIWAELDGLIKPGTFIPQNDITNADANAFLEFAMDSLMKDYERHRFASGSDGDVLLDLLMADISNPEMGGRTNNAARINSREGDGMKRITKQRAIGNAIWIGLSRSHHGGYFTVGRFFELLHKAHHEGIRVKNPDGTERLIKLSEEGLRQILHSDKVNYNIFVRSLTSAAQADFEHGLKKLGALGQYSHAQIMEIAEGCRVTGKKNKFIRTGAAKKVSEKIAYFATLYAEAHRVRAFSNAVADGTFAAKNDPIEIMNRDAPKDAGLRLEFNEAAKERWNFIERTRDYAQRAKSALLLMDYYEGEIKAGAKIPEAELRQAGSLHRATTLAPIGHISLYYEYAHGRRTGAWNEDPKAIVEPSRLQAA